MRAVAVVGNPKPASRTADAAQRLARALGADDLEVIDLIELGGKLIGWGDPDVAAAVARVQASDLAIFASPTFKASYTGLLKLFLDQFATGTGLEGVVAVPLMLGAGPGHALAPELLLKPVLVELGATTPAPGLYQLDSAYVDDPKLAEYVARWAPVIRAITAL
ncbi:NADPH-dependent FMN reductase [Gryllotalpicola reticulitermitis]|uniref:NADPH-dependent FMN reductase n=1 Tax=Gryllotalpicola reticulitermitis TaxID=1184153 RepID=A0ABV8Q430_9MICO